MTKPNIIVPCSQEANRKRRRLKGDGGVGLCPKRQCLKVRKSRKQFMVSSILSKKNKKIILWTRSTQNHCFCLFKDTIICFRDLLTFNRGKIGVKNGRFWKKRCLWTTPTKLLAYLGVWCNSRISDLGTFDVQPSMKTAELVVSKTAVQTSGL